MPDRRSATTGDVPERAYVSPAVQRAARLLRRIAKGDSVTKMSRTARQLGINRTTLMRLIDPRRHRFAGAPRQYGTHHARLSAAGAHRSTLFRRRAQCGHASDRVWSHRLRN